MIDETKHLVLKAAHPSPYSANNGFLGCRHFSKTNEYLVEMVSIRLTGHYSNRYLQIQYEYFERNFLSHLGCLGILILRNYNDYFSDSFFLFSYFKKDPLKTMRFIKILRVWMDIYLT